MRRKTEGTMVKRRFRIAVVIEQEYAPGEWVGKMGRQVAIIEDGGEDPDLTPERTMEEIATVLEIKLKEIEREQALTWPLFEPAERPPLNRYRAPDIEQEIVRWEWRMLTAIANLNELEAWQSTKGLFQFLREKERRILAKEWPLLQR